MPTYDQHVPPGGQGTGEQAKKDLSSWWKTFKKGQKKEEEKPQEISEEQQGIFGVPLQVSVRYANVAISLTDANGQSYIYGYVPIIVAKCGVFLKEKATDVEGIFRLSGSEKRIKELRSAFNSPDRYGKGLDWTGYTVHDAANILRRYFNQLPEPIIPLDFYEGFRQPLVGHQSQAVGHMEGQTPSSGNFSIEHVIKTFQQLITELPPLNRQLLLYILDLLAVFASKSDMNKMTTPNLAAIFQPGILSHPQHDMAPEQYRLSQDVLIFLIENQDHFLIGMQGTAADEKTVQEVESGPPTPQPRASTPRHSKSTVVRTGSNSSRYSGIRRSVSASSRRSRNSGAPSPAIAVFPDTQGSTGGSSGVHRSNTLPPTRSPNLNHSPFGKERTSGANTPEAIREAEGQLRTTPVADKRASQPVMHMHEALTPTGTHLPTLHRGSPLIPEDAAVASQSAAVAAATDRPRAEPINIPGQTGPGSATTSPQATPTTSAKGFSSFFGGRSPPNDSRKPNKLQKKRNPGSPFPSAHSSTHSLNDPAPEAGSMPSIQNSLASTTPLLAPNKENRGFEQTLARSPLTHPASGPEHHANLKPRMSPSASYASHSDNDLGDIPELNTSNFATATEAEQARKRHWFSRKNEKGPEGQGAISTNGQAARSRSSVLSSEGRKSFTVEGRRSIVMDRDRAAPASVETYDNPAVTSDSEKDKKNPISWIKGKLQDRADRKEDKDRKRDSKRLTSPPPFERFQGGAALASSGGQTQQQSQPYVQGQGQGPTSHPTPVSPKVQPPTPQGEEAEEQKKLEAASVRKSVDQRRPGEQKFTEQTEIAEQQSVEQKPIEQKFTEHTESAEQRPKEQQQPLPPNAETKQSGNTAASPVATAPLQSVIVEPPKEQLVKSDSVADSGKGLVDAPASTAHTQQQQPGHVPPPSVEQFVTTLPTPAKAEESVAQPAGTQTEKKTEEATAAPQSATSPPPTRSMLDI